MCSLRTAFNGDLWSFLFLVSLCFPSVLQVDEDIIEAPIVPHEHAFILNRSWRSQCSSDFCFPLRLGLTC